MTIAVDLGCKQQSKQTNKTPFCEFYSAFHGISHYKLFAIFLPNCWNLYQIILSHTLDRGPNESLIKKIKCGLERIKVYYCFNSEGDTFNANQL